MYDGLLPPLGCVPRSYGELPDGPEKVPRVRPIRIGKIWRWLLAKFVLKVASAKAKDACSNAQLCVGLEAGIEGVVHAACTIFFERDNEEEWDFLLVDTAKVFNAGNHIACLWMVRHRWPSGAQFSMDFYSHQALLLICINDGYAGNWLVSPRRETLLP